ncbi:MAG: tetratricopeptide repeat protein [Gemmataceae bacterium]
MTTSSDARPPGGPLRRYLRLAAILLLLAASAATAFWWIRRTPLTLLPPTVPRNETDRGILAVVEKARGDVLKKPRSARAWGRLGQVFLANELNAEAEICLVEAERLDSANPRWPYYQAAILVSQGQPEAAVPILQRAVERGEAAASDNLTPSLLLAETLLALGRLDEAEKQFRHVLKRRDEEPRAHYGLALVYAARSDWPASRTHLERCLENPWTRRKACVQLAVVCRRLGEASEAEKYHQLVDRLPPDQDWIDPFVMDYLPWAVKKTSRYRHAEALEARGQLREAAQVLQELLEESPNEYRPRVALAKVIGLLGDHAGAERLLREALRLAPEKVRLRCYLSLTLFARGEALARNGERELAEKCYREAVQRAREALAVKADFGLAYMALGLSLKALGQRADALAALRQAVHCNPENAELHFYLGELLAQDGQQSEARQQLQRALEMAPANASWRPRARAALAGGQPNPRPRSSPK